MVKKAQINLPSLLIILAIILAFYFIFVAGKPDFGLMIANMQAAGIYSYVLPFILVFAIAYALLMQGKIVGDPMVAIVISLVVGLFAILFFSTLPIMGFLASLLGRLGIILIILLVVFLMYGFLTKEEEKKK